MQIRSAAAVLRVADVSRSIAWYVDIFGFEAHPFFVEPYVFAVLERPGMRLMLSRSEDYHRDPSDNRLDLYIALTGGRLREVFAEVQLKTAIKQPLQHMPYGDCEFEIMDPDGHVICIGELLDDPSGIPDVKEE
jgi:uncharacterized glyoxalase superfamily protein PhnB